MNIPEPEGLTKEIMDRLVAVGDSEKIKSKYHKWVIKDNKGIFRFVDSWDAMVIMCKLVKLEALVNDNNNDLKGG